MGFKFSRKILDSSESGASFAWIMSKSNQRILSCREIIPSLLRMSKKVESATDLESLMTEV